MSKPSLPCRPLFVLTLVILAAAPARAQEGLGALFDAVGDEETAREADALAEAEAERVERERHEELVRKARREAEEAFAKKAAEESAKKASETTKAAPAAAEPAPATPATPSFASHFAGSSLIYQPAASAISFYKAAEPMWNPYVAQTLILRPVYAINKTFSASMRFMLMQELTTADDTNTAHELVLGDAWVDVTGRYKEPSTGINFSGGVRAVLPLSKAAFARSLIVGISPGGVASRHFDLLRGVNLRYLARFTVNVNRWTTGQLEGSTLIDCPIERAQCASYGGTRSRNGQYGVWHGPGASFTLTPTLDFSIDFNLMRTYLYALNNHTVDTLTGPVEVVPSSDVSTRYITYFILDLAWQATPAIGIDLGVWTWGAELGPDGLRRNPFFNRETTVFLSASYALGEGLGAFF